MKKLLFFLVAALVIFSTSCRENGCTDPNATNYNSDAKKDDGSCYYEKTSQYDAELYADYTNPVNGIPSLSVNFSISSPEINIEADPSVSESNGRILFNYSAVTFRSGKKVYKIDSLVTERKNSGDWIIDDENKLEWNFSKSLDVILVLDVSSSLGENIAIIKENAKQFVSDILNNNDEARIGVLKFSRGNVFHNFSSNEYAIHNFIETITVYNSPDIGPYELEGRSETALFESVNDAIDHLELTDARGKGILTFTDGINNFWFDPVHFSADTIIEKLSNSTISNYTIGFEGNQGTVDKSALEAISINGDYSFPTDFEELSDVFVRFSNSVAAVYDLVYNTNNAQFEGIQEYRFLFMTTLISGN